MTLKTQVSVQRKGRGGRCRDFGIYKHISQTAFLCLVQFSLAEFLREYDIPNVQHCLALKSHPISSGHTASSRRTCDFVSFSDTSTQSCHRLPLQAWDELGEPRQAAASCQLQKTGRQCLLLPGNYLMSSKHLKLKIIYSFLTAWVFMCAYVHILKHVCAHA